MDENKTTVEEVSKKGQKKQKSTATEMLYDIIEQFAIVSAIVLVMFAFVIRLNIVDGSSMDKTLAHGQNLAVSNLFYEPKVGDIVIIHDVTAIPYDKPIVKRVIATEGQTVDIDFFTWTLTVDGEVIDESAYRFVDPNAFLLGADYEFPITVPKGEIFVLGDNRNGSADSRQIEIGTIDTRCVVGRAVFRISPLDKMTVFKNPFGN